MVNWVNIQKNCMISHDNNVAPLHLRSTPNEGLKQPNNLYILSNLFPKLKKEKYIKANTIMHKQNSITKITRRLVFKIKPPNFPADYSKTFLYLITRNNTFY